jgi:hypothetical protein
VVSAMGVITKSEPKVTDCLITRRRWRRRDRGITWKSWKS